MKNLSIIAFASLICLIFVQSCAPSDISLETLSNPSSAERPADEVVGDSGALDEQDSSLSYPIVDTGQIACFDDSSQIACPQVESQFFGQDAQYDGYQPAYLSNGDGTVTDLVTGLMWTSSPDLNMDGRIDIDDKLNVDQAVAYGEDLVFAGYDDWRLPSIKELYSLVMFSGVDPNVESANASAQTPFINTEYFAFGYGDLSAGERLIDAQIATTTRYVSTTMNGAETMFGYNFADGRIKGYPVDKLFYAYFVRGNEVYGENDFEDNGNGTITDMATGLTWMQADSGEGMGWEDALAYCEDMDLGGSMDWRLPNAKELQSIVDYRRSPDTTASAAIDPLFSITQITNEAGQPDFAFYWTSTTHMSTAAGGRFAVYISFGRALGFMRDRWMDVHGAGAQRSDPKTGSVDEYPTGHGPQGDAIRVQNYVRCVTGGANLNDTGGEKVKISDDLPAGKTSQAAGSPPQAAIDACAGTPEGAGCIFSALNGNISGTCREVPGGETACVP